MKSKFYLILLCGYILSFEKIDINNASIDDIMSLPLSKEKNNSIWSYLNSTGQINSIYDLLYIDILNADDIHSLKKHIKIVKQEYDFSVNQLYKTHNWLTSDGNSQGLAESYLNYFYNPRNINHMTYDDIYSFPNLTPMDVVAVLKQQKRGGIKEQFHLKNSGISNFGRKNLTPFVSYSDISDKISLRYSIVAKSFPSTFGVDEESIPIDFIDTSSPETLIKFMIGNINEHNRISIGLLRSDNIGQPANIYSNKFFISIDKMKSKKSFRLDKLIIGNFKASFGQGLVFESTDYLRRRNHGRQFSKRQTGISPDFTKSHQFTLDGVAVQFVSDKVRFSYFLSNGLLMNNNMRDAVINSDGSFSALITMNQRLEYGYSGDPDIFHHSLINSVEEWTIGSNIRYSPTLNTNLGITFYESLYDRVLNPQFLNTIIGGEDNEGDETYLNYMSNSTDSEMNVLYSNSGKSDLWSSSKSFRRVLGFNINTVIKNLSFQAEYGQIDTDAKYFDDEPEAFIANSYIVFDNFNLLVLYRNYDLDYDNPYQRSFAQYQKFKSAILEDDYKLNDLVFYNLYQGNAQPQAEEGIFVSSRYQFHRALTGTLEWDSWVRKADKAQYYRIVGKLDWRPVFKYRINFRYKWQERAPFNIEHPSPYYLKEARVTFTLNLSNYNNIELLYAWSYNKFSPRPRLTYSPNPFIHTMAVSDAGSPEVSMGASFEHRLDDNSEIKAGIVYVGGFLWYIDDSDINFFNSNSGLIHNWIAFNYRANNFLTLRMKLSHTSDFSSSTVSDVEMQNGSYMSNTYTFSENINYKIQLDYAF